MAEFRNVEMHASQQHGITHATGYPKEASVGYNDHDSSIRESGRPDLQEKSAQSAFNIVETPMRSATTFFVPPQQQRDQRWWHRIGRPGIITLTFVRVLHSFVPHSLSSSGTAPTEQEVAIIVPNFGTTSYSTAGQHS
ncbi:hypothetical protein BFJ68_g10471 [Fusarium oxysporum]|uniref:Uncharacterized protein n=2 Tax=Fusarium oxysporum TaxID=5507 RepID=A0A420QMK5_FUSOX|nr:hypothetical protein FOZG_12979 [Fusarium oxysporum Fo47]RKL06003.1 hypothetical protein BFJ68_g10471 [Fusarium oxysporum]